MISCRIEQVFISELAYAADYVISRKGNIESPAFVSYSLFPQNYNDFHYEEYCNYHRLPKHLTQNYRALCNIIYDFIN